MGVRLVPHTQLTKLPAETIRVDLSKMRTADEIAQALNERSPPPSTSTRRASSSPTFDAETMRARALKIVTFGDTHLDEQTVSADHGVTRFFDAKPLKCGGGAFERACPRHPTPCASSPLTPTTTAPSGTRGGR